MKRLRLEVADVIREHGGAFLDRYGATLKPEQRRVLDDLASCRTADLGGHVEACDHCGHQRIAYNSCRNRHCPKCQATAAAEWLDAQAADLLPVPYFHVVFTLPSELNPLALRYPRVVYDILMRAAAETLQKIAADPKHLGAEIGILAVLHTWGQNLELHPHVHCVVTGGGLADDGDRWIAGRERFFLPVRVLGRVFRGKVLHALEAAIDQGRLRTANEAANRAAAKRMRRLLQAAARKAWVVYAKPPHGGPEQTLKYLARYTHRVAISNHRLVSLRDGQVRFRYKDYAHGNRQRVMRLDAVEFLRRFLMHVLPSGFVRIRHYGLLANRSRRAKLARCRELLEQVHPAPDPASCEPSKPIVMIPSDWEEIPLCPICGVGRMVVVAYLPRSDHRGAGTDQTQTDRCCDTS